MKILNNFTNFIKQFVLFILTITAILSLSVCLYFLHFVNQDQNIKIVGTIGVVLIFFIGILFEYRSHKRRIVMPFDTPITKLVLITRDGDHEKQWFCNSVNSFLIGKGTRTKEVDIELGDTHYTEFISNEHAVLNFSMGYWYVEDLSSTNGVGLKKKGDEFALRLKPLTSYKVDVGDIIYISKAKLLVR